MDTERYPQKYERLEDLYIDIFRTDLFSRIPIGEVKRIIRSNFLVLNDEGEEIDIQDIENRLKPCTVLIK